MTNEPLTPAMLRTFATAGYRFQRRDLKGAAPGGQRLLYFALLDKNGRILGSIIRWPEYLWPLAPAGRLTFTSLPSLTTLAA